MTLAMTVWPGVFNTLAGLIDNPPDPDVDYPAAWGNLSALQGVSEGEQLSVGRSPWAWMTNDNGDMSQARMGVTDREASNYTITVTLLYDTTNNPALVEHSLMALESQIRAAFRAHIKLGYPTTIAVGLPDREAWGYMPVNAIMYRTLQLFVVVTEKMPVSLGP